jgi:hypothetical protein
MAFPQGVNFRNSSGYVSDVSPDTFETSVSNNYPRTTAQGNTVGYTANGGGTMQARNRNSGNDPKLAGCHFITTSLALYRIDLPAAGTYRIRLALGEANYACDISCDILDDFTLLTSITGATGGSNRFLDATGVARTHAAWLSSNAYYEGTFATTILRVRTNVAGGGTGTHAHVYVEEVAPPVALGPPLHLGRMRPWS